MSQYDVDAHAFDEVRYEEHRSRLGSYHLTAADDLEELVVTEETRWVPMTASEAAQLERLGSALASLACDRSGALCLHLATLWRVGRRVDE